MMCGSIVHGETAVQPHDLAFLAAHITGQASMTCRVYVFCGNLVAGREAGSDLRFYARWNSGSESCYDKVPRQWMAMFNGRFC
jgi:hypothetical protein